jgi:hypothetical protein
MKMNFETSTECNSDKVSHHTTLQTYSKSYITTTKFQNELETTKECNNYKVNHEKTLQKYPKS